MHMQKSPNAYRVSSLSTNFKSFSSSTTPYLKFWYRQSVFSRLFRRAIGDDSVTPLDGDETACCYCIWSSAAKGRLELQSFLDFFATHVGMLAVFEEARALVFAEELDDGRRIGRVVRWPSLKGLKGRLDTRLSEEHRGVFAVFIEIGIEDALIHHVALPLDGEDQPPQVVCLEYSERGRIICDCFLDDFGMVVYVLFPSGDDFCNDGEAVARRSLGKDRTVPALLNLVREKPPLGIAIAALSSNPALLRVLQLLVSP